MKRILILILVLQAAILQLVDAQVPGCSDAIPMVTNSEELVGEYTLTSTGSEIKLNYCEGEFSTDFYKIFKLPNGQYNGYVWTGNPDVSLYFAPCCGDKKCSPQYPISQWTGEINLLEAGFCVTSNSGYIIAWADQVETFRLYFRNNGGSVTCEEESYCEVEERLDCNDYRTLACGQIEDWGTFEEPRNVSNYCGGKYTGLDLGEQLYQFIPPSTGTYTFRLTNTTSDLDMFLLSSCDKDDCIESSDGSSSSSPDVITITLTGGRVYWLVVDTDGPTESNYKLTVTCACPSEDCTKVAATLNCDNNERVGAINGLDENDFNSECSYRPANCYSGDSDFNGNDEVIRIDIGDTPKDIVIDLTGLTGNLDMFLFDQCTTGEVSGLVGCIGNSIQSGTNSERISVPNASGTYSLVIDT